jgi:hypothetical protein
MSNESYSQDSERENDKQDANATARTLHQTDLSPFADAISAGLLALVLSTIIAQMLVLAFHRPISAEVFPVSVVLALVVTAYNSLRINSPSIWRFAPPLFIMIVVAASLTLASWLVDFSSDGQWYHQQAILELLNGWNPLYVEAPESAGNARVWIDSYAKGSWIFAASVATTLGSLEAGKGLTFILTAGAFLTAFSAALNLLPLSTRDVAVIAVLAACSPVFAYQYATYYLDAQVAAAYAIALSSGILWAHTGTKLRLHLFLSSLVILAILKFTGLVYAAILFFGIVLWRLARSRTLLTNRDLLWPTSLFGLLFLVAGFNPYVTNFIDHGTPFYPLMGKNSIDFISQNVSPEFATQPSPVKLAKSLMAESNGQSYIAAPELWRITYKLPFQVNLAEIATFYRYTDVRIAGLGPWFSAALMLATITLFGGVLLLRQCPQFGALSLILTLVLITVAINPESWMMRYAPQLWLVPASVAAVGLSCPRASVRLGAQSIIIAMLVNLALVAIPASAKVTVNQLDWGQQARTLRAVASAAPIAVEADLPASIHRLRRLGIRFEQTTFLQCQRPFQLVGGDAKVCLEELGVTETAMESRIVAILSTLK